MRGALRVALAATVATVAVGCATGGQPPVAAQRGSQLLGNADFEMDAIPGQGCPPRWWCSVHNRPDAFRFEVASEPRPNGRFLKVTRVKEEPWAMVTQALPADAFRGRRVTLSAAVLAPGLQGEAGPMILVQGGAGAVIAHRKSLVKAGEGWRRATVELDIPPGAAILELALVVEGGGWVGFDDAAAFVE